MGAEVLEETEFEPFFESIESKLTGKKVGLFGSYDWGDGEWMRTWQERTENQGAILIADGLIVQNDPDAEGLQACKDLAMKAVEASK
jgi:flavodoxin